MTAASGARDIYGDEYDYGWSHTKVGEKKVGMSEAPAVITSPSI